jgi:hypothetical protein
LPVESVAYSWGDEIYFEIPVELEIEDGREILEIGDIAYLVKICASFSSLRPLKQGP